MTLIAGLVLNEKKGGGFISDARQTGYLGRTSDIGQKIFGVAPKDKPTYFVGFSGNVSNHTEVENEILKRVSENEPKSTEQLEEIIKNSYRDKKNQRLKECVLDRYNVSWEEFKHGSIDSRIMERLREHIIDAEGFSVSGIAGGKVKPDEKFRLSYIDYPGTMSPARGYASVGSGSERADLVMSDYLHGMNTEKRKDIPLNLGTRILLESMESGWRNIGVGGTGNTPGQIVVAYGDEPFELDRNHVNLLHDFIFLEKRGLLDKNYVNKVINDVVETKKDTKDIVKELGTKIDTQELNEFLLTESLQS